MRSHKAPTTRNVVCQTLLFYFVLYAYECCLEELICVCYLKLLGPTNIHIIFPPFFTHNFLLHNKLQPAIEMLR